MDRTIKQPWFPVFTLDLFSGLLALVGDSNPALAVGGKLDCKLVSRQATSKCLRFLLESTSLLVSGV